MHLAVLLTFLLHLRLHSVEFGHEWRRWHIMCASPYLGCIDIAANSIITVGLWLHLLVVLHDANSLVVYHAVDVALLTHVWRPTGRQSLVLFHLVGDLLIVMDLITVLTAIGADVDGTALSLLTRLLVGLCLIDYLPQEVSSLYLCLLLHFQMLCWSIDSRSVVCGCFCVTNEQFKSVC